MKKINSFYYNRKKKQTGIGNRHFRMEADVNITQQEGGRWRKQDPGLVGTKIPEFRKPVLSPDVAETMETVKTAYDYYRLFQPDTFANEVVYQSKLYAVQKDYKKQLESVSIDTYR